MGGGGKVDMLVSVAQVLSATDDGDDSRGGGVFKWFELNICS